MPHIWQWTSDDIIYISRMDNMIQIKQVTLKDVDAMIVPVFEDQLEKNEVLTQLSKSKVFTGKEEEIFVLSTTEEGLKYTIYMGVGTKETFTTEGFRNNIAKAVREAKKLKVKSMGITICVSDKLCVGGNVKAITEATLLANYTFDKYQSKEADKEGLDIYLCGVPEAKLKRANEVLEEAQHVADGVILARDLTNEPSNVVYPETLAQRVVDMGKEIGLEVEVRDEKQIEELGMKAFLAVGASSEKKPRLIVMRHMGDPESDEILGLVGKGITYDTGGYSLKPTDSMKTMHSDMGGAASVIGTMYAIAQNKVKKNVIAVVAACENIISGGSYKPGDIINSMACKTIEIGNTDAEGRLTLADAVTYSIEKEKVTKIIDIATLTGAVLVALGTSTTGVITNDTDFYDEFIKASEKTGEKFWRLPSTKEYAKLNKSTVADLKNVGGRNAGTITAGLFVGEFVQELPWMHLDIAGTAWADSTEGYLSKGGTGVPVRSLYALVAAPCPCHEK